MLDGISILMDLTPKSFGPVKWLLWTQNCVNWGQIMGLKQGPKPNPLIAWALNWAKILDIVKIIVISFFGAFLAQITQFGSLINHMISDFLNFLYISNWASFYLIYFKIVLQA